MQRYLHSFVFGDFHYNASGNALVADAVLTASRKSRGPGGRWP